MQASTLTIKNSIPELARMSLWLTGSLGRYGLSRELQFKFDLCANEAVANIISYAYTNEAEHEISLDLDFDGTSAKLTIKDDGIAFNPLMAPEHMQPKTLEDAKIGGLGIDIIRHYMDSVNYQRDAELNILSLQMNIESEN